jgi:hypothetical protein
VVVGTHVDDNPEGRSLRDKIFSTLQAKMQLEDRGSLSFALDTKVERDPRKGLLKLSQRAYTEGLLKEYGVDNATPSRTPYVGKNLSDTDVPKDD